MSPFIPTPREQQPKPCMSPEHNPPGMVVFRTSGTWVCPACGRKTLINVPEVTL